MTVTTHQTADSLISLCMIVKNEQENLGRCLLSVAQQVDEMIIVDTGSTDQTVQIAATFGAQIRHFQWCDDFATARNYAMTQATGQWILMLDADEELVVQSSDWRNGVMTASAALAYTIDLKDADDSNSLTAMRTPRLFRNHPKLQYAGRYHEHLEYEHQPIPQTALAHLKDLTILHYGYAMDILPKKSLQRIPTLENIRQQEGLDLMLLWTLSGMYDCAHNLDKVQECYAQAFDRLLPNLLCGEKPTDFRAVPSWMYSLGVRLLQAEDIDSLRLLCQRGQEWCPTYPPLGYLTGLLIKSLGFDRGAIPYFEACIEAARTGHYFRGEPFDPSLMTTRPALEIGMIYMVLHQKQEAKAAFERVLSFDPTHRQAQEQLAMLS
jgi:tetratricopeptide (TPR) repeat protein